MATQVYKTNNIILLDGTELEISPLKIKYLREFLEKFELVKSCKDDIETIQALSVCARVCMKQFKPDIATNQNVFEDNVDLAIIYSILDYAGGVKINKESEEPVKKQAVESGSSWDNLDLAKLESEIFLLGIWKDYDHLEKSLSMPELQITLEAYREQDYNHKKFLAAMQGVDLDKNTKKNDAWEEMKARVYSKGQTSDPNDIVSLQGQKAVNAGFGIGLGLSYERID